LPSTCGLGESGLGPNKATEYLSASIVSHVASCWLNARHSGLGAEAPTVAKPTYSQECVEGASSHVRSCMVLGGSGHCPRG